MTTEPAGGFSAEWFRTFLDPIAPEQTEAELDFVERHLPVNAFPSLLDLCCGPGRHAPGLVRRGYRVAGVDVNADAVALARSRAPGASFTVLDMRRLDALRDRFDGVLSLWHSFGYFDDRTNEAVLRDARARLRPGGRLLIDLYNREHAATLPEVETTERSGGPIETRRTWQGSRLTVALSYPTGARDVFEWRLYTPAEFMALAASVHLRPLVACAWFSEDVAPSVRHARMQFVVERPKEGHA